MNVSLLDDGAPQFLRGGSDDDDDNDDGVGGNDWADFGSEHDEFRLAGEFPDAAARRALLAAVAPVRASQMPPDARALLVGCATPAALRAASLLVSTSSSRVYVVFSLSALEPLTAASKLSRADVRLACVLAERRGSDDAADRATAQKVVDQLYDK